MYSDCEAAGMVVETQLLQRYRWHKDVRVLMHVQPAAFGTSGCSCCKYPASTRWTAQYCFLGQLQLLLGLKCSNCQELPTVALTVSCEHSTGQACYQAQ